MAQMLLKQSSISLKYVFQCPTTFLSVYVNLLHTPQCYGLDLLLEFETCLSYDKSLTKAH